jgi:hypothetical protein
VGRSLDPAHDSGASEQGTGAKENASENSDCTVLPLAGIRMVLILFISLFLLRSGIWPNPNEQSCRRIQEINHTANDKRP